MQSIFNIVGNFTAIIMMVVGFRFLAWVGLCGRAYIAGGIPALEAITKRKVHVVEEEIYAGAFLLCTMALGALMQPSLYHLPPVLRLEGNNVGSVIVMGSIALMLCWRLMHQTLEISHPWRVILAAAAMAFVVEASVWTL